MSELPREAEAFLRDLERCLAPLAQPERRDVVAEIRSHLADRAAEGVTDLLGPFGSPRAYADAFLEERALAVALAGGSPRAIRRALLQGARRVTYWYAVAALGLVQVAGACFVVLSALKLVFPANVGLFLHGSHFTLGAELGSPPPGIEMLGWWAVLAFLCIGMLALWSARWSLRLLATWRLARIRPALDPRGAAARAG